MSALLAQAQQMQQKLLEAQHQLANSEVHGQAGGGLVQVRVKGSGEVIGVTIDPKVVDPNDIETLQDLIVGAMRDASQQVTKMAQERLGALAGAMRPPAPPGAPGMPGAPGRQVCRVCPVHRGARYAGYARCAGAPGMPGV
ncbi:DNA-binding protein, YbaB/EbfC family [Mycobacterium kansasii]|uniref:Nucleoid-associated protein BZL30_3564 n=1 Tax=Mycobacterium kansasii TaxID=1768 RepID=A0A1V3X845_MYCKA|nr:DNA-binding protein, YbaB/EbfC family [Mycobacterium kansasii]